MSTPTILKFSFDEDLIAFANDFSLKYRKLGIGEYKSVSGNCAIRYMEGADDDRINGARVNANSGVIDLDKLFFDQELITADFVFYTILFCVVMFKTEAEDTDQLINADLTTTNYYLLKRRSPENLITGLTLMYANCPQRMEANNERLQKVMQLCALYSLKKDEPKEKLSIKTLATMSAEQKEKFMNYYNNSLLTGEFGVKMLRPTDEFDSNGLRFPVSYLNEIKFMIVFLPLELMAEYADIVTTQMIESIDSDNGVTFSFDIARSNYSDDQIFLNLNATAIGNLAYICLNSKSINVKGIAERALQIIFDKAYQYTTNFVKIHSVKE